MISDEFRLDLLRYPKRAFLKEQSIWAVALYRIGRASRCHRSSGLKRAIAGIVYRVFVLPVETATGITIPITAVIGEGLRIWHFGGIVVHANAVIGRNCTIRHGVTIGSRIDGGPAPTLGDSVDCGAYAQILGGLKIGSNVKIGALSLVLEDVSSNRTVGGNPARVLKINET